MRCDIHPPNYMHDMDGATPCPLPHAHDGSHRTTTPRWGLIEWQDDDDCECCIDSPNERCIVFGPVSSKMEKGS